MAKKRNNKYEEVKHNNYEEVPNDSTENNEDEDVVDEEEYVEHCHGDVVDENGDKVKQKIPMSKRIHGIPKWVKITAGVVAGAVLVGVGVVLLNGKDVTDDEKDENEDEDEDEYKA